MGIILDYINRQTILCVVKKEVMNKKQKEKKEAEEKYYTLMKLLEKVKKKTRKGEKLYALTMFYKNKTKKKYIVKKVTIHIENEKHRIELHFNPYKLKGKKWIHERYKKMKVSHVKKVTLKKIKWYSRSVFRLGFFYIKFFILESRSRVVRCTSFLASW